MKSIASKHSRIEITLHNIVFKSWFPLLFLSKIESRLYQNRLTAIENKKPVFITALPRAGTTLLLELCVSTQEFAAHRYSDMPFLLAPLFWNLFSTQFRRSVSMTERIHRDGIKVNSNSPESFEEIIWKEFWASRYRKDRIIPWSEPNYPVFEDFFLDHMRKVILLRSSGNKSQYRYISKNNLNIARIGYLKQAFPESIILVPFRNPLDHASSLLRQHRNFLNIHKEDPFACKYMEDTGHFDFGKNLRPVNFNDWLSREPTHDPNTLSFWLKYWINTYQYLMTQANDKVVFFSYDLFCNDPGSRLEELGKHLEIKNSSSLMGNVDRITSPKPYSVDTTKISTNILDQADAIFSELQIIR